MGMFFCGLLYVAMIVMNLRAEILYEKAGRLNRGKHTRFEAIQAAQAAAGSNPLRSDTRYFLYYLLNKKYISEKGLAWPERKRIRDLAGQEIRRAIYLEPAQAIYHADYANWLTKKGGMLKPQSRSIIEDELRQAADLYPLYTEYRKEYDRMRAHHKV